MHRRRRTLINRSSQTLAGSKKPPQVTTLLRRSSILGSLLRYRPSVHAGFLRIISARIIDAETVTFSISQSYGFLRVDPNKADSKNSFPIYTFLLALKRTYISFQWILHVELLPCSTLSLSSLTKPLERITTIRSTKVITRSSGQATAHHPSSWKRTSWSFWGTSTFGARVSFSSLVLLR